MNFPALQKNNLTQLPISPVVSIGNNFNIFKNNKLYFIKTKPKCFFQKLTMFFLCGLSALSAIFKLYLNNMAPIDLHSVIRLYKNIF